MSVFKEKVKLVAREAIFRTICRHEQGSRPNILLFCSRRGGSTWVLNTIAAHPGMRYVGRPFMTVLNSRWANKIPDLKKAGGYTGSRTLRQIIHFEGQDELKVREAAKNIIDAKWHVYPTINYRAPYFHRQTDRVIFQMTSGLPLINWFESNFHVQIAYLVRHPIPTALSIMNAGWGPECFEFLENNYFVETYLTDRQIDFARKIEQSDDLFARHVLDWCLKNLVPLRQVASGKASNWLLFSYEDLVLRPVELLHNIAPALDLEDVESMLEQVQRPSRTVTSSTADRVEDVSYLLRRWRLPMHPEQPTISADREHELMKILDVFDLDVYVTGRDEPASPFLLPSPSESAFEVAPSCA